MKFGGTSMAGIERIRAVANRVKREAEAGNQVAVVVSAMAGETDRLVQLWIREEALRMASLRWRVEGLNADRPLALRLMNKLVYSELNQDAADLACQIEGPAAGLWLGDPNAPDKAEWPRAYMNSFGVTIGGGTSEIQRNILGERVLGLPKSK